MLLITHYTGSCQVPVTAAELQVEAELQNAMCAEPAVSSSALLAWLFANEGGSSCFVRAGEMPQTSWKLVEKGEVLLPELLSPPGCRLNCEQQHLGFCTGEQSPSVFHCFSIFFLVVLFVCSLSHPKWKAHLDIGFIFSSRKPLQQ